MSELHELTALRQAAALRAGEVSSAELVEHYLDRIERHDAALGAFITITADVARADARAADDRLRSGADDLPVLHGVPIGLKDLHPTAGIRTTFASAAFADFVPPADGVAVGLIRAAGMPVLGKTNAPEFGPVCYTSNALTGEARTPYDLTRSASGSSGGAAAAVAAGLMPVGHASDGAGSIRTPAAVCGLVGFKPSRGLVSPPGPAWMSLGIEGPVARTVGDAAALLDLIAHPAPGDLYPVPRPESSFVESARRPPGRLRIARFLDPGTGAVVHPEVARVYADAGTLLADLGHELVDITFPLAPGQTSELLADFLTYMSTGMAATVAALPEQARPLLQPFTRFLAERAEGITAAETTSAQARLAQYASAALARMAGYDAVLSPATLTPPVPCGSLRDDDDGADEYARMADWSIFTPMANLTGQPSVSLPVGETADGLPVGVLLTGGQHDDATLMALAAQLEEALAWYDRHPPMWTA